MSYNTKDKSVDDGAPVECYEFVGPFGTHRYTNNSEEVTVAGETYTPLNISRNDIEVGSILSNVRTVDVTMPANCEIAFMYCFLTSPKSLTVTIRRVHRGDDWSTDYKTEWVGTGMDCDVRNNWATIKTGSVIQAKLNGAVANITYQRICNHKLYDERCKVNKEDFTIEATVTKVQNQIITVDNDQSGNNELKAGEITVDRTGEVRSIYDNINNELRVGFSFIDIQVGDTVKLVHGCDHKRLSDCKVKFNNVVNYGGFDHIPTTNPFTDLAETNQAKITTAVYNDLTDAVKLPDGNWMI